MSLGSEEPQRLVAHLLSERLASKKRVPFKELGVRKKLESSVSAV
jgi:hypothetical protein